MREFPSKLLALSMFLAIVLPTMIAGCGKSNTGTSASLGDKGSEATIAEVARVFLDAVRSGDSAVAASQLTSLAQQRMRAADMDFQLLANEQASFQIGRVEKLEAAEAIVETIWSEPNGEGTTQQEQWTLALQFAEGQWRILGIVAETGPNQPPVVMDFENPGNPVAPPNTAGTAAAGQPAPQQAVRPSAQDPFRQ